MHRAITLTSVCLLFLACIAALNASAQEKKEKTPPKQAKQKEAPLNRETLRQKMEMQVEVEFVETPLKDVVDFLADYTGIPIVLDVKSLEEGAISVDTPVTKHLQGLTLRTTLHLLLHEIELVEVRRDGYLLITTPEKVRTMTERRVYPASHLPGVENDADMKALIEVIQTTVAPESWHANRLPNLPPSALTPGRIAPYGSALVILQSPAAHDEIQDLLHELYEATGDESGSK